MEYGHEDLGDSWHTNRRSCIFGDVSSSSLQDSYNPRALTMYRRPVATQRCQWELQQPSALFSLTILFDVYHVDLSRRSLSICLSHSGLSVQYSANTRTSATKLSKHSFRWPYRAVMNTDNVRWLGHIQYSRTQADLQHTCVYLEEASEVVVQIG